MNNGDIWYILILDEKYSDYKDLNLNEAASLGDEINVLKEQL